MLSGNRNTGDSPMVSRGHVHVVPARRAELCVPTKWVCQEYTHSKQVYFLGIYTIAQDN